MKEFRDAVDYVRKAAWAVQEWQERQLQKRDPLTVLPLLSAERIRRATQLSKAITADLTAHGVTHETAGMDEFFRAIEGLYQRVSDLLQATVKSDGLPKHPGDAVVGIHGGTYLEEMSVFNSRVLTRRRTNRTAIRKRAGLILSLKGRAQRLPCLIVDSSQGGLRLRGSFRLKPGQVVEVLSDDGFWTAQCRVIWIGKPGSKQEGEAGLQTV